MNDDERKELVEQVKDELGEVLEDPGFWKNHLDTFVSTFSRYEGVDLDDMEEYPEDSFKRQEAFQHIFGFWAMEVQNELIQDDDWRDEVTTYILRKYKVDVSDLWPGQEVYGEPAPDELEPEEPEVEIPSPEELARWWELERKKRDTMSPTAQVVDELLEQDPPSFDQIDYGPDSPPRPKWLESSELIILNHAIRKGSVDVAELFRYTTSRASEEQVENALAKLEAYNFIKIHTNEINGRTYAEPTNLGIAQFEREGGIVH